MNDHAETINLMLFDLEQAMTAGVRWSPEWIEECAMALKAMRDDNDRLRARVSELELILAGRKPLIEGDAP